MDIAKIVEIISQNELPFVYSGDRLNDEKCRKVLRKIGADKDVLAVVTANALFGIEGMAILKTGIKFSFSSGMIEGFLSRPKLKGEYAFSDFVISDVSVKKGPLDIFYVSMALWDKRKSKSFVFSFNMPEDNLQYEEAIKDKLTNVFKSLITKTGTEYVSPSENGTTDDVSVQSEKNQNEYDFKWFSTHTTITVNDDNIMIRKQKIDKKTQIQTPKGEAVTISRSAIGSVNIKRKFSPLPLFAGIGFGVVIGFLLIGGGFFTLFILTIIGLFFSYPKTMFIHRKDGTQFKTVISGEEENVKEYERFINVIFR
jgi:hypothetical protein